VNRWIAGGEIYGEAEARLRFAFQVVRTLSDHDSPALVQAWLTGVNPNWSTAPHCGFCAKMTSTLSRRQSALHGPS
jgi:hypothetical protein